MTDIPETLLAKVAHFLAGCDDAAELRGEIMEFLPTPVDPVALALADIIKVWGMPGCANDIRQGQFNEGDRAAIEALRKVIAAAMPVPVEDAEVVEAFRYISPSTDLIIPMLRHAELSIIRTASIGQEIAK